MLGTELDPRVPLQRPTLLQRLNVFDYCVQVIGKSRQEDKPKDLEKNGLVCVE